MGREIRRVPPNWQHPKYTAENSGIYSSRIGRYMPLYDRPYIEAITEWIDGHRKHGLRTLGSQGRRVIRKA